MSVLLLASIVIKITTVICKIDNQYTKKPLDNTPKQIVGFTSTTSFSFRNPGLDFTLDPPLPDILTDVPNFNFAVTTPPFRSSPGKPGINKTSSISPSKYFSFHPDYDRISTSVPISGFNGTPHLGHSPIQRALNDTRHRSLNRQNIKYTSTNYFTNGLEKILNVIIDKNPDNVMSVIRNSERLFISMLSMDRFQWLGKTMKKVVINLLTAFSRLPHKHLQGPMKQFHYELIHRHLTYSPQTNNLFDSVNKLIETEDAERIYNVLQEFEHFPKGNKTGNDLCRNIIEAFETPFRKKERTNNLRTLMKAVNLVVQERYPIIEIKSNSRKFGPSFSELQKMSPMAQKRVAVLSHVDIFLGRLQDALQQSNTQIQDLYKKHFPENGTPAAFPFDSSKKSFMNTIKEQGWIAYAWQKFWTHVLFKKAEHVAAVAKHLKSILNQKIESGEMNWMQGNLKSFIMSTVSAITDMPINFLVHSSRGVYNDIKFRQKMLSPEVNQAIDFANSVVKDEDGFRIFKAIKDFEEYPREEPPYISEVEICHELINSFARPFQNNTADSQKLNKLVDEIQEGALFKNVIRNKKESKYFNNQGDYYALLRERMDKLKKTTQIPKKNDSNPQTYNQVNQKRPFPGIKRTKRSLSIVRNPSRLILLPNNPKLIRRKPVHINTKPSPDDMFFATNYEGSPFLVPSYTNSSQKPSKIAVITPKNYISSTVFPTSGKLSPFPDQSYVIAANIPSSPTTTSRHLVVPGHSNSRRHFIIPELMQI